MTSLLHKIAFASIKGMGLDLAQRLLDVVGSEEAFFAMSENDIKQITGGRSRIYKSDYRAKQLEIAERELKFIADKNIHITYYTDHDYPQLLLETCDAPLALYSLGNCNLNSPHLVSFVGTRHATNYGTRMATELVEQLHSQLDDLVVVSGLAYGIDIAAHRAAMRCGAPTVAVMARGLNRIYPAHHRNDAIEIVRRGGVLVTDYLCQDEIHRGNFLARNRIIAGMCMCTVVIESASSGGALVTASLANSYNRDVFACPGRAGDEFSRGCNRLIRSNQATSITCAQDIIDSMRWDTSTRRKPIQAELFPNYTPEEQLIIDLLQQEGDAHVNTIANRAGLPIYKVLSALVEMDCKGYVIALPGSRYTLHK